MKKSYLPLLILVLVFSQEILGNKIKLVGTIVAYERSLARVSDLTHVPKRDTLIVRVEKPYADRVKSRYVKVIYEYLSDRRALPQSIFEGDAAWQLKLKRRSDCDNTLSKDYPTIHKAETLSGGEMILFDNPSAYLTFTRAQNDNIPTDLILPCYSLRSGFAARKIAPSANRSPEPAMAPFASNSPAMNATLKPASILHKQDTLQAGMVGSRRRMTFSMILSNQILRVGTFTYMSGTIHCGLSIQAGRSRKTKTEKSSPRIETIETKMSRK